MADMPEGVFLEIRYAPEGGSDALIAEFDMEGYDPNSSVEAGNFGQTVFEAVGRWMEKEL